MTQPTTISDLIPAPESRSKPISNRGGLRFLYRLGQGGMAEVHVAACAVPGSQQPKLLVVKRMHLQHLDDPATVRMFQDEARLALCLQHPNIVRTERLGMFDGRHGIVMEYLEGQPFHQLLKRAYETEASLSLDVIAQIGIAALDGLHYAHELKDASGNELRVVHRDVSPQNLFITYDGAVKMLDFGIAKNALADARTRTGLLKGKISYMAPEQARGEHIDRRADLWSLGVMLWEAVTGSRLFKGSNEAATLNMTLSGEVSSPSMRRPDLPPELEAILMRALKRDPEQRYASAAAMRDDLEAWLSSRELTASSSVSQLMRRLFAGEMQEQRLQIQECLHASTEPSPESGLTLVAPLLGAPPGTWSGLRSATQVSSVTDLMEELTRQRRTTTRLLGSLLAIFALAALVGLYLLVVGTRLPATNAAVTLPAAVSPPAAPAPAAASASASAVTAPPAAPAARATPMRAGRAAAAPPVAAISWPRPKLGQHADRGDGAPAPAPEPVLEHGFLNLDTTPWSVVSVGGRALGQTPLVGASLPAGTHTLLLSNPELGLKTTYQVTISAGRTTARRIGLD
jgi:serine/threonine protein kinase